MSEQSTNFLILASSRSRFGSLEGGGSGPGRLSLEALRSMWSQRGPGEGFAKRHSARRSFSWDISPGLLRPAMDISKERCEVPSDYRKKHLPHVPFHIPSPHTSVLGAAVVQRSSANGHDPRGSRDAGSSSISAGTPSTVEIPLLGW